MTPPHAIAPAEIGPRAFGALPARQYLYVIGAPRSGTTWLQALLGAHPAVVTSVEMTLFDCYLAPWFARWNEESAAIREGRWHQGLPAVWSEAEFVTFIQEFVGRVYERVAAIKPMATHLLDKQPSYAHHVTEIDRIVPQARFIHIVRDGRDVVSSALAARRSMGFGPHTTPQAARQWASHVRGARRAATFTGRYFELRYEQLLAEPAKLLGELYAFCDLAATNDLIGSIVDEHSFDRMRAERKSPVSTVQTPAAHFRKGQAGTWRDDLSRRDRIVIDEIAGDLLVELGYAQPGWWSLAAGDSALRCLRTGALIAQQQLRRLLSAARLWMRGEAT